MPQRGQSLHTPGFCGSFRFQMSSCRCIKQSGSKSSLGCNHKDSSNQNARPNFSVSLLFKRLQFSLHWCLARFAGREGLERQDDRKLSTAKWPPGVHAREWSHRVLQQPHPQTTSEPFQRELPKLLTTTGTHSTWPCGYQNHRVREVLRLSAPRDDCCNPTSSYPWDMWMQRWSQEETRLAP